MARTATSDTLSSHVYTELRHAILSGAYAPGERLKPSALRLQYGVSVSVVREALSRLAEQRLVRGQQNQGFCVIELSEKGLREITDLRVLVEGDALRRSIARGDFSWEARVIAAHHVLARTPERSSADPDHPTEEWASAHRAFHCVLLEACEMPMLLDICASLFDASELYRRLSAPLGTRFNRDAAREHREICDAVVARDADLSMSRLSEHFNATTALLIQALT